MDAKSKAVGKGTQPDDDDEKKKLIESYKAAFAIWSNDSDENDEKSQSITQKEENNTVPLSIENLDRKVEEDDQLLLKTVPDAYMYDVREIAFRERMEAWLKQERPDYKGEGANKLSQEERKAPSEKNSWVEYQASESASTNPYLAERTSRINDVILRIDGLNSYRNARSYRSIKQGTPHVVRYAMYTDVKELMRLYNSYIPTAAHCLDNHLVTATDICNRINDSRKHELPFIIAVKREERNAWNRGPQDKIIGFVRLINFLDGQDSVAGTAQLEIMVDFHNTGLNVGRCLMDAILTIADPRYTPRGGYVFQCGHTDDWIMQENRASISCRPLTNLVTLVNHTSSEVGRYERVKQWLKRECMFNEKGNLPSVAQKLGQPVNIAFLVRVISP